MILNSSGLHPVAPTENVDLLIPDLMTVWAGDGEGGVSPEDMTIINSAFAKYYQGREDFDYYLDALAIAYSDPYDFMEEVDQTLQSVFR